MVVTAWKNGNEIKYIDGIWKYPDGTIANYYKPCPKCGKLPHEDGRDACLLHLYGVSSACCGHGVFPGYVIKEE